ncbi:MAG: 30S ribosomal protein S16 [Patescibacteria group bacterium]
MLKIRLQRVGKKHDPSFRLVLTDSKNGPQSGKFLEVLGSYNARFGKPEIKGDRVTYWISKGAQVSDTVHNLLINEKIIEGKKINVLPRKSPVKKEGEEAVEKDKVTPPVGVLEKAAVVEKETPVEAESAPQVPLAVAEPTEPEAPAEPTPVVETAEEKKEEAPALLG